MRLAPVAENPMPRRLLWLAVSALALPSSVTASPIPLVARVPTAPAPLPGAALRDVLRRRVLRVGLPVDRTSYTVVRGQVVGLEYEVLSAFARDHGLRLQVVPLASPDERYDALATGAVDAVAGRLDVDVRHAGVARWSRALATSPLVLVAPSQAPLPLMPAAPGPAPDLSRRPERLEDLADVWGATAAVPGHAGWLGLSPRLPAGLDPIPWEASTAEDLLADVASGRVGLALVRSDLARLEAGRSTFTVGPELGVTASSRVAFARDAGALAQAFDTWLAAHRPTVEAARRRNLEDPRTWRTRAEDRTAVAEGGALSPFDRLMKHHASRHGLDWRLVAALSYQESRWRPRARSFAGAVGLMQLMPATARQVGVRNRWDAAQSIAGGAAYLGWLDRVWARTIPDARERLPFVLASYNAGLGHVADARALAAETGTDPDDWDEVAPWLLRLSEPEWYRHPRVRYGYCRGTEPVDYVTKVLDRWQHYRSVAPEDAPPAPV